MNTTAVTSTSEQPSACAPIGIFDSGLGGLTVASEIARALPHEPLIYLGDTSRCPYGPRDFSEVRTFVREICSFLSQQNVKLLVVACNTGAAAALTVVQQEFDVPIIGVIDPGARAAVRASRNRRIGVIGTTGTVASGAYEKALHALDAGIEVDSVATPRFVDIVEEGLLESGTLNGDGLRMHESDFEVARQYLAPLKEKDIDTLILGCTHYPLLAPVITRIMGPGIGLISSAQETAHEVEKTLERRGQLCEGSSSNGGSTMVSSMGLQVNDLGAPPRRFYTTGDTKRFTELGSLVLGEQLSDVRFVSDTELAQALEDHKTRNK